MSVLILAAALLNAPPPPRPDLSGRVTADGEGPIAGAVVFVSTAAPRTGTSMLCPSCYADCARRAETADDGSFRIASLDPDLLFSILIIADGYRPTFAKKVDPALGELGVTLSRLDPDRLAPEQVVRGRVLGPEGSPVAGATVEPQMFETAAFNGYSPDIFDPVAVTDLDGRFVLTANSAVKKVHVKVEGRGLAPRIFADLKPDGAPTLRLSRGAELKGRVVKDGQAVAGAVIGLVHVDRGIGQFLGHLEVATDPTGRFLFSNVAPGTTYYVYGVMESLGARGSLPARAVKLDGDGTVKDVGELALARAQRLAGRVVLADGKPVPPGTRLLVSRDQAWDSRTVTLDPEGRFAITGLPDEEVSVLVRVPGYILSSRNKALDPGGGDSLTGTADQDIDNLTILLEQGAR